MKYQEGLEDTKAWLRDHSKAEVLLVLAEAGLSKQKAEIVLRKFCEEQRRDPASYDLAMHLALTRRNSPQPWAKLNPP